jgi:ATP-dependent DNA ligase
MVRRDGSRVRCFTRNGYDWADRFPAIVDAALPRGLEGRVEADGCTLSQRAVKDVAQVEEPGERGGAPGTRGGVALKHGSVG